MEKKDILFLIVTINLLSLFSGIVITGIIRKESFCLMICLVAALLFFIALGYFILQCLEEKRNIDCKKTQYGKLDKIFENIILWLVHYKPLKLKILDIKNKLKK